MSQQRRWDPCVAHHGEETDGFLDGYFGQRDRSILLVAGIGFDPRSSAVAGRLTGTGAKLKAVLLTETRPSPSEGQLERAARNRRTLLAMLPESQDVEVEIFGADDAVVGGRSVVKKLRQQALEGVTDVVVDTSALSIGISFPIVRYFVERIASGTKPQNLHVLLAHDPQLDAEIRSIPGDAPSYVHGFKGGSTLSGTAGTAKLWLPQLARSRRVALGRLHEFVAPDDTCPILPFPASDPRRGDMLAGEYLTEFESSWSVDERNIVFAAESDPLDLYRTLLQLDDLRRPVFAATGGSMLVLSPLGGKAMALGALLAAMERDLPVAYIEPVDYELGAELPTEINSPNLIHVWLEGEVYPQRRPALRKADRNTR